MKHADILALVPPLDCKRILELLHAKDCKASQVAAILNIDQATVSRWKEGHLPREPNGRRLMAIFDLYYPGEKIPVLLALNHSQREMTRI